MNDFITLTCNSCGGKLQITSEIKNFACMYCGTEYAVNRGEGVISLSPITDEIKKVQIGVDKTASELAIVRINKELPDLSNDREKAKKELIDWEATREIERNKIIRIIKERRRDIIAWTIAASFGVSLILTLLIRPSLIIFLLFGTVISAINIWLVFSIDLFNFSDEEKLHKFDNDSPEIEGYYKNKVDKLELMIKENEIALAKHKNIVRGDI